jgi:hypothetical protein
LTNGAANDQSDKIVATPSPITMEAKKFSLVLTASFAFFIFGSLAQAQITVTVVETFNYPGATETTSTIPRG